MARTALTVNEVDLDGLVESLSAANVDGHSVAIDRNAALWIEVQNDDASPINVTIQTPKTTQGLDIEERVIAVANGTRAKISLEDTKNYKQADGTIYIDFSAVTSITCGAFACRQE